MLILKKDIYATIDHTYIIIPENYNKQSRSTLAFCCQQLKSKNTETILQKRTYFLYNTIRIKHGDMFLETFNNYKSKLKKCKKELVCRSYSALPKRNKKSFFKVSLEKLKDPLNVRKASFQKLLLQSWEQVQVELEAVKRKRFKLKVVTSPKQLELLLEAVQKIVQKPISDK